MRRVELTAALVSILINDINSCWLIFVVVTVANLIHQQIDRQSVAIDCVLIVKRVAMSTANCISRFV